MKYLLTLVLISAICLIACYQEESNKYTTQANGLNFTKTEVSNGVVFNWEEAKMFNFTEYIITKHPNSTPAITSIEDLSKLSSINIMARIKSRQSNSANDSTSILRTYYRLYVVSGTHFLASDEIVQNSNFYTLQNQNISQTLIDRKNGRLYLFYSTGTIEIIDLKDMKQIAYYNSSYSPFINSIALVYDQNGNTEIYSSNGDKIFIFEGDSFKIKDIIYNIPKGKGIYNIATDENSNIFFVEKDTISKYDPITKKITKLVNNGVYQSYIKVTGDGRYILTGYGFSLVNQYNLSQDNRIISMKRSSGNVDFTNYGTAMANVEPTLIAASNGAIYNKDFQYSKILANEVAGYAKSVFDERDKIIYSVGTATNLVYKFENKDGYKFIGSLPIKSRPTGIFIYDGKLILFGMLKDFNSASTKYVLEKVFI